MYIIYKKYMFWKRNQKKEEEKRKRKRKTDRILPGNAHQLSSY